MLPAFPVQLQDHEDYMVVNILDFQMLRETWYYLIDWEGCDPKNTFGNWFDMCMPLKSTGLSQESS